MKKLIFLIIVFFFLGSFIIIKAYDIKMNSSEGKKTFIGEFLKWAGLVSKSSYKTAGFAVKQDWLPNVSKNLSEVYDGNSSIIKKVLS